MSLTDAPTPLPRSAVFEQRRMHQEIQRQMQEVLRRNNELERQVLELRSRPPPAPQQLSLHASLGSSNVSGGSSSLGGGA